MSTRTWPVNIPRQPVKPRRAETPLSESWLFRINPQRALEIENKKRSTK